MRTHMVFLGTTSPQFWPLAFVYLLSVTHSLLDWLCLLFPCYLEGVMKTKENLNLNIKYPPLQFTVIIVTCIWGREHSYILRDCLFLEVMQGTLLCFVLFNHLYPGGVLKMQNLRPQPWTWLFRTCIWTNLQVICKHNKDWDTLI